MMVTTIVMIRREWRPVSTVSSRVRHVPTPMPRGQEHQKRDQAGLFRGSRGSRHLAAPVPISLPRRLKVGPSCTPNLPCTKGGRPGQALGDGAVDPWPCRGLRQGGNKP